MRISFFVLVLFSIWSGILAPASASPSYSGNVSGDQGIGLSAGNGSSVSATVEFQYSLGNLIAISLPEPGERRIRNSLFKDRIRLQSSKYVESSQEKITEDILSDELADASREGNHLERLDFFIHGLIFSSNRKLGSMSISTSNPGSINNHAIKLINQNTGDEVECDIEVRFRRINWIGSAGVDGNVQRIRLNQPLVSFNQNFFNRKGFAKMAIRGEVHPKSVTVSDQPGNYIGNLTISVTNL